MNNKSRWQELLRARESTSLSQFKSKLAKDLFLLSPNDSGVIRNGGKRGARFAPETLVHLFSKMNSCSHKLWCSKEVANPHYNSDQFDYSQKESIELISAQLSEQTFEHIVHLGGGHDHIYPLAQSVSKKAQGLIIINVDAHLDTRDDSFNHSGTPFRQISHRYF